MTKTSVNGSLYQVIWKRNICVFDVKMESYSLLSLPPPVFKGNDSKDMKVVKYKEKLVVTCFDGENIS